MELVESPKLLRKTVSGIMLALLLMSMLTLTFSIQPVKASGTIYIRADGSIDPPTAPIQRNGSLYTFTDNIYDEIVVERCNTVIDGAGYTLQRTGSVYSIGIYLSARNVTVKNTTIRNFYFGVHVRYGGENTLTGNNITASVSQGIYLEHSSNNNVSGNNIADQGIVVDSSSNNSISKNNLTQNGIGIYLGGATSVNNSVCGNNIVNNYNGILCGGANNIISGNNLTACNTGIDLYSENNHVVENNIVNSIDYGIRLEDSSNNSIYHNNLIGNAWQVFDVSWVNPWINPSINAWDDGYPSGGNYWSDYNSVDEKSGPNQDQPESDGIGDTPYIIDANNTDRYPLMKPYGGVDLPITPQLIVISGTKTWYGDLIVNGTQTVVIKDSNFIVVDGFIRVFGNLTVLNSTIRMVHSSTPWKFVTAYGSGEITFNKSTLIGWIHLRASDNSMVSFYKSSVREIELLNNSTAYISDSTFGWLAADGGRAYINNSIGTRVRHLFSADGFCVSSTAILNSNITSIELSYPNLASLELNPGYIENLTLSDTLSGSTLEITNSIVNGWQLTFLCQSAHITNSTIACISFRLQPPSEPDKTVNLTITTGRISYKNIYVEHGDPFSPTNITVIDSIVNSWNVTLTGGVNTEIRDSTCSISASSSIVSIYNSTIPSLRVDHRGDPGGNLTLLNSTVGRLNLVYSEGVTDLVLNEGYLEHLSIYNSVQRSNVTIIGTCVNSWSILAMGKPAINIYNSTLTYLMAYMDSSIHIQNSNISSAYLIDHSSLTLINSRLNTLYAYDKSTFNAVNSTIMAIISDPPTIILIDSSLMSEVLLPFALEVEYLTTSIEDESDIPLPPYVWRISKYLRVKSEYTDYIEAQVRIYYTEEELEAMRINETDLRMYTLDESSNQWHRCPVQGVNTTANYVWANVTGFSYFVIAISVPDIGILSLETSKSIVGQGYSLEITIEIVNYGIYDETFDITLYANKTVIGVFTNITLTSGNSKSVTFTWNSTVFAKGNYIITADTADSTLVGGTVTVTILGDVDGNFEVDIYDITAICVCYDSKTGEPMYYPNCDLDGNGIIDIFDVTTVCITYGQKYP